MWWPSVTVFISIKEEIFHFVGSLVGLFTSEQAYSKSYF